MRFFIVLFAVGCGSAESGPPLTADSDVVADSGVVTDSDLAADTANGAVDSGVAITDSETPVDVGTDTPPAMTYPAGPYGIAVGNVVANLELEGYVRADTTGLATAAPYGATSFAAIRAASTKKYALVHVSGFT